MKHPINRVAPARQAMALVMTALTIAQSVATAAGPGTPEEWYADGQAAVRAARQLQENVRPAKNIILFIGDGMGVSTVTAARILEGQLRGESGEENVLAFENFPYLALSKTYSVNQQTSDSAPTMTAMVSGIKTKDGLLGVNQYVMRGQHLTVASNEVPTILEIFKNRGRSAGVVSTARITHATPAACYAHTADRNWEADADMPTNAVAANFPDIARQLVEFSIGGGLDVALGGGRSKFIPLTANDPEDAGRKGSRKDGRDLTAEWAARPNSAYVWNKAQFDAINPATTSRLLGLFERSHCEYEADRALDTGGEPSLTEMTGKAIDILSKNRKGYFLMVEGGRVDHAHHAGNAYRALTDTIEMAKAVKLAMDKTSDRDTLIIVSADHSHVFTIGGYPVRGNPITGLVLDNSETGAPSSTFALDLLGKPYTTLSYANGPGYTGASFRRNTDGSFSLLQAEGPKTFEHLPAAFTGITSGRPDLTETITMHPNYLQEATVPMGSETHAGEDVAIYATGPGAHLFHGTREQNYIFHVMLQASKLR